RPVTAGDLPDWVRERIANPSPAPDVAAVVLDRETRVVVKGNGELRTTERTVLQIGTPAGREHWTGFVVYHRKRDDVRMVGAGTVGPDGKAGEVEGSRRFDAAANANDVLGEVRVRGYVLDPAIGVGTIAAFEGECERKVLLPQMEVEFQTTPDS